MAAKGIANVIMVQYNYNNLLLYLVYLGNSVYILSGIWDSIDVFALQIAYCVGPKQILFYL